MTERVLAGTAAEEMLFADMQNTPCGPGAVPAARCVWCGAEFDPAAEIVSAVESLSSHLGPGQSPCLDLPDAAFADPRLLSTCPHCGGALKFNPFLVNCRER